MPWCPKCKNEYREGIKVCADCGVELVSEPLENAPVPLTFGDKEQMAALKSFLEYNELEGVEIRYEEAEDVYEIQIREKDKRQAEALMKIFFLKEAEAAANADSGDEEMNSQHNTAGASAVYESSASRAEDNRSSAYTLLIVGTLGIVAIILLALGVIPLNVGNPYMFYGIMSALFILFLVMGCVSMRNAKIFAKKAESENSLRDTMENWCRENLKAEEIDRELYMQDAAEEVLYFKRYDKIKEKLNRQFMNLDQNFLDQFIDETVYDMVYPRQ